MDNQNIETNTTVDPTPERTEDRPRKRRYFKGVTRPLAQKTDEANAGTLAPIEVATVRYRVNHQLLLSRIGMLNLTLEQVAERVRAGGVEMKRQTIYQITREQLKNPGVLTLMALAAVLGLRLDEAIVPVTN